MQSAMQGVIGPSAPANPITSVIRTTSAGPMNAYLTRTAQPHKNVKMRSVLTHVSVPDLLTALREITGGTALAYLTILEIPMESLAHQVSFQKRLPTNIILQLTFLSCLVPEPVIEEPGCITDGDCPSRHACFSGECLNPCLHIQPCTANAECVVKDELPLRVMVCTCNPGYTGKGDERCELISMIMTEI